MVKFTSLPSAVKENLFEGDTVAFEGFTHLIPFSAAHEVIRQKIGGLTLVRMTPDIIYDQLIGVGLVRKMIFSYAGNPGVGLLRRMRDGVENQWPNAIELEEHSHSAMAHAFEAGASGLPFGMFRGYLGAGLKEINANIRSVTCPYTGEELAAVPALNPDVTFIHAQKSDKKGNVLIEGILGVQKEAILSAKRSIVTVEEVVDDLQVHPNACVLPHWTIDAIAVVPGGAHPSYAHGYYNRDNAFYLEWDKISADRQRFLDWINENVTLTDPNVFAGRVDHLLEIRS